MSEPLEKEEYQAPERSISVITADYVPTPEEAAHGRRLAAEIIGGLTPVVGEAMEAARLPDAVSRLADSARKVPDMARAAWNSDDPQTAADAVNQAFDATGLLLDAGLTGMGALPAVGGIIKHADPDTIKKIRRIIATENRARGPRTGSLVDDVARSFWLHNQHEPFPRPGEVFKDPETPFSTFPGEPREISLSLDRETFNEVWARDHFLPGYRPPEFARVYPLFGAPPEQVILPVWDAPENQWAKDALTDAWERATWNQRGTSFNEMSRPQLSMDTSKALLDKGYKAILHTPFEIDNYSMHMLDPASVLMMDHRVYRDPDILEVFKRGRGRQLDTMQRWADEAGHDRTSLNHYYLKHFGRME